MDIAESSAAEKKEEEERPKKIEIPVLDLKKEDIPDAQIGVTPKPPSISVQGDLAETLKGKVDRADP